MSLSEDQLLHGCIDCGNTKIEANGRCASCNHAQRKAEREASKPVKPFKSLQRTHVKKVSSKRTEENKEYTELRADYLKEHPKCEANLRECTGVSVEIHHKAKRGKNYLNPETFMAVCRDCHITIEQFMSAAERREQGFLIDVKPKITI